MWHDPSSNELKWYDKTDNKWVRYFNDQLRITDEIMSILPPDSPVRGQLWLHNGVLCYFDGTAWNPVKAMIEDGSQFDLGIFKNFMLVSPLWKIGNTVVPDKDIEAFARERRKYLQGVLDAKTDSQVTGDGSKWSFDSFNEILNDPTIPEIPATATCQLLVPHIDYGRVFIDHDLDVTKYTEVSKVCIQYKKKDLLGHTPSLVHLNPGKLTKIEKRIFKIDRTNPKIIVNSQDTEFYGFQNGNYYGDLLLPNSNHYDDNGTDSSDDDKTVFDRHDYTYVADGILLEYNAAQNYDYVLAVHYEFSWMKSTGRVVHQSSTNSLSSFYIDNYNAPFNVFVDGYNLEDPYYDTDGYSKTVTLKEDVTNNEVNIMHVPLREYGYIRSIDIHDRGVIRPLNKYKKPLLFINGEAVHPDFGDVVYDDKKIYVNGAKIDMAWAIIDLVEPLNDKSNSLYEAKTLTGYVGADKLVHYDNTLNISDEHGVLFIDGLLVKKGDMIYDRNNKTINVAGGLKANQEFILIEDKYDWLYDEKELLPALSIGKFTDSLVYFNGKLLCNDTAIDTLFKPEEVTGTFNEIKCFCHTYIDKDTNKEVQTRDYRIWNIDAKKWDVLSDKEIAGIKKFAYSYQNMPRSVSILIPYTKKDRIEIYGYNQANAIEYALIIKNVYVQNQKTIKTVYPYQYDANSLRVWCNGIRQYPTRNDEEGISESIDGNSFDLPEPFTGRVTYVIELPENNQKKSCSMEILDETNITPGYVNVYKTKESLFPGRVTLYINGIRQPKEAYTVFDNHTLMINDDTSLIGNSTNYPSEDVIIGNRKVTLHHSKADKLLVEVRNDDRQEQTIKLEEHPVYDIDVVKYSLPLDILEANDEIMIFADGLYFGPQLNEGYTKNVARGVITIQQNAVLSTMNTDEEKIYLDAHDAENQLYLFTHENKPYKQYNAQLTFEWR